MKKILATVFLMLSFVCCICMFPAKANAASSGSFTRIPCQFETTQKVKIGKYYAYCKRSVIYFSKTKNGKTYCKVKNPLTDCFCNGKVVYYITDNTNYLCKLTLSSKKITYLKKMANGSDPGIDLVHIYGNSFYFTECPTPSDYLLKFYNAKTNKITTITKYLCDGTGMGISGRYIAYINSKNDNVYLRDCSSGKTTVLKDLHNALTVSMYGNLIGYTVPDSTGKYLYVRTYNIKKKTVTEYAHIGANNNYFSDGGTFSADLSTYTVEYTEGSDSTQEEGTYTVNLKTKEVIKAKKK